MQNANSPKFVLRILQCAFVNIRMFLEFTHPCPTIYRAPFWPHRSALPFHNSKSLLPFHKIQRSSCNCENAQEGVFQNASSNAPTFVETARITRVPTSKEVPKPRPGKVLKRVLRKVPVPNGVPRKVPKKCFGVRASVENSTCEGTRSTFSALSSAPRLESALSEALFSALVLVGALALLWMVGTLVTFESCESVRPPTRVKIAKIGKRGFQDQKLPFPSVWAL